MKNILCSLGHHDWEEYLRKSKTFPIYRVLNHYRRCKKCDTWEELGGNYSGSWWEHIPEVKDIYNLKRI